MTAACEVTNCPRKPNGKLCKTHGYRAARALDLTAPVRVWKPRAENPQCTVTGCVRESYCRGVCAAHYMRMLRGAPMDAPLGAYTRRGPRGTWGMR